MKERLQKVIRTYSYWQIILEGKPYKIGDELYLGGTVFSYPNANITDQIKVNWIECGLDRGWLGG